MIEDVTAGGVYWNEAHRLPKLLDLLQAHFSHVVVVVQESTDGSLQICQNLLTRPGDRVREDAHRGAGDPSFPIMVQSVETEWIFVVSGDEMPSDNLLESIPAAIAAADELGRNGIWIRFHSTIQGIDFTGEQDMHLRLFRTSVGWPHSALHSRPMTDSVLYWDIGWIDHDRSLDEMVADYLRYIELGRSSSQWTAHNVMMLRDACTMVAEHTGWSWIISSVWWPEVRDIAFGGSDPQ
jgi:glycosyltransferase involved in cell wall biosynthesis